MLIFRRNMSYIIYFFHSAYCILEVVLFVFGTKHSWNEPRIHFVFILSQINLAILRDICIVYVQILRNQDRNTYI
jgi:hypothetical protein